MLKKANGITIISLSHAVPAKLHHAHCSSVVAFPDGELLAAWYWAIKEADINEEIFFTRKTPSDMTWSEPEPWGLKSSIMFDGNPILWIAPDTGLLHVFYNAGWGWSCVWAKHKISEDRGRTWKGLKPVYPFISRGLKNPPILTSRGFYVLPAYVEFNYLRGVFYISNDQGRSWKQSKFVDLDPAIIADGYAEKKGRQVEQPTVIERSDGSLLALCRNDGQPMQKMLATESFDGGYTWTPARNYMLPNPAGGFHMLKLQSGNVAIIYNHAPTPDNDRKWRNPLSIALSEDDGKSWTYRQNILEWHPEETLSLAKQQEETFQYPTMTQGPDGTIHATWSHSHAIEHDGAPLRVTDIDYTSFSEEWIKEKPFFESAWVP